MKLILLLSTFILCGVANGGFIGDRIESFKKYADELTVNATQAVKGQIEAAKNRAQKIAVIVKNFADFIINNVNGNVNEIRNWVKEQLKVLADEAKTNNIDVSDCMQLANSVRYGGVAVLSSSNKCIDDKIETSQKLVKEIENKTVTASQAVNQFAEETAQCLNEVNNVVGLLGAAGCTISSKIRNDIVVLTQIPIIAVDIMQMVDMATTLPNTMGICMSTNAVLTLEKQARDILTKVTQCVKDRIFSAKKTTSSTTTNVVEYNGATKKITTTSITQSSNLTDQINDKLDTETVKIDFIPETTTRQPSFFEQIKLFFG
ncbi:hypothetical protein TKK_0018950 [Trichogramma kaykai]